MRWLLLVVLSAACGRYRFDDRPTPPDACTAGATCTPAAVCWTGAESCGAAGCAVDQRLDQIGCPGGTCVTGVCMGSASPPFMIGSANAYFGTSLDSDGQRIVVGAVRANSAYVLERSGTTWAVTATLTSPYGPASSDFGAGVAIDGDLIVVGSRYSRGPGMPPVSGNGGAIAIYQRNPGTGQWQEIADVLGPDGGEFGGAVDISGGRILVGAEYGMTRVDGWGDAYIVEGAGASWSVVARFDAATADRLGHFVQLSGDRAVVGSLWDPGPNSSETGAVRVWERQPDSTWSAAQTLQPDDPRPDAFGQGFSLDGDRLAVGVPWFADGDRGTGAVYLYTRDATGVWQTPGPILPTVKQRDLNFGRGIWLRGDRLFVTSIDWSSMPSGAVTTSVYRLQPDGQWLEVGGRLDPGGGSNGFAYGGIECDLQMTGAGDDVVVGFPVRGYSGGQAPGAIVFQDVTGL